MKLLVRKKISVVFYAGITKIITKLSVSNCARKLSKGDVI